MESSKVTCLLITETNFYLILHWQPHIRVRTASSPCSVNSMHATATHARTAAPATWIWAASRCASVCPRSQAPCASSMWIAHSATPTPTSARAGAPWASATTCTCTTACPYPSTVRIRVVCAIRCATTRRHSAPYGRRSASATYSSRRTILYVANRAGSVTRPPRQKCSD